jgi:hypothetical protein
VGFLRRVFGGSGWPASGPITSWPGESIDPTGMNLLLMEPGGRARLDVVGESYYQGTLERIAGGRTIDGPRNPDHMAALIPQPANPYDRNAVRAVIVPTKRGEAWGMVGHLSREDAVAYRPVIDAVAAVGHVVGCRAYLTGGWDRGGGDRGNIGVVLVLGTPRECADEAAARGVTIPQGVALQGTAPEDRPYARSDCPYCGAVQDPLPKSKRKCPACGQLIYVRSGPDGHRHMLRESDLDSHQATWDAHYADQGVRRGLELSHEAARMSRGSLASYADMGASAVQVIGGDDKDTCPACRAVSGRVYPIRQAPSIPIPGCANDRCRCDYVPVT